MDGCSRPWHRESPRGLPRRFDEALAQPIAYIGSRYLSGRTRAWLKTKNRISAALAPSFDHLVGADDKRRRKREAERLCTVLRLEPALDLLAARREDRQG